MMKLVVRSSGFYQGRRRTSTGIPPPFHPACFASTCTDMPLAMPETIDIPCCDVVESDALTIRNALAESPR
jgi:hypothetical protein